MRTWQYIIKHEKIVLVSFLLFFILFFKQVAPTADAFGVSILLLLVICATMIYGVFNVVKHAHVLAEHYGEPYGTLILTLAVIIVEVALIVAVMLAGKAEPTLARDTMFAVIMIAINGFAGVSILAGGLRHKAQQYHLCGAKAYLSVLIPVAVICLILPNYTSYVGAHESTTLHTMAIALICIFLYATFLLMQTVTHVDYFKMDLATPHEIEDAKQCSAHSSGYHFIFLIFSLIGMILLSKMLAVYLDFTIVHVGLPISLGGFIIALIILLPEGVSAVQAASKNNLQRSVNLCLGSSLATICLTVPTVSIICLLLDKQLVLGLSPLNSVMLGLTLLLCLTTFTGQKTHFLNGAVHLAVFLLYLILLFN